MVWTVQSTGKASLAAIPLQLNLHSYKLQMETAKYH